MPLGRFLNNLPITIKEEIQINNGDLVLFYPDGAVESRNENKELFEQERLRDLLKKDHGSPSELMGRLESTLLVIE